MREAADILDSDAAMQIRYLETISKLSQTSKIILLGEDENWENILYNNAILY